MARLKGPKMVRLLFLQRQLFSQNKTYPNILENYMNSELQSERAIFSPSLANGIVNMIDQQLLDVIAGEEKKQTSNSVDSILDDSVL